jgi:hypothetical protein
VHHWIFRSANHSIGASPLSQGIAAGCPYCRARQDSVPQIGQRIQFLASGDMGQTGVRVDDSNHVLRFDQFAIKMDYEKRDNWTRVVTKHLDLFIVEPFDPPAPWLPSLSYQDTLAIHEGLLRAIDANQQLPSKSRMDQFLNPIISACWNQRLPVSGLDLWPMLAAHGFAGRGKKEFIQLFDFGVKLLIWTQGRPPIKKGGCVLYQKDDIFRQTVENFTLSISGTTDTSHPKYPEPAPPHRRVERHRERQ